VNTPAFKAELAWLDGILAAARQDRVGLASARAAVEAAGDTSIARPWLVSLVAFELALRGNRRVAASQLSTLDIPVGHPIRGAIHRMAAASWLLEAGDTSNALKLLTWHEAIGPPFIGKIPAGTLAYLELARVEQARGQFAQARRDYRQFLVRYDMPPASHRHLVVEASAALGRLSGAPDTSEAD
jgi:hypothetical protein